MKYRVHVLKQIKESRIAHSRTIVEVDADSTSGAAEIAVAIARNTPREWAGGDVWFPTIREAKVMLDTAPFYGVVEVKP